MTLITWHSRLSVRSKQSHPQMLGRVLRGFQNGRERSDFGVSLAVVPRQMGEPLAPKIAIVQKLFIQNAPRQIRLRTQQLILERSGKPKLEACTETILIIGVKTIVSLRADIPAVIVSDQLAIYPHANSRSRIVATAFTFVGVPPPKKDFVLDPPTNCIENCGSLDLIKFTGIGQAPFGPPSFLAHLRLPCSVAAFFLKLPLCFEFVQILLLNRAELFTTHFAQNGGQRAEFRSTLKSPRLQRFNQPQAVSRLKLFFDPLSTPSVPTDAILNFDCTDQTWPKDVLNFFSPGLALMDLGLFFYSQPRRSSASEIVDPVFTKENSRINVVLAAKAGQELRSQDSFCLGSRPSREGVQFSDFFDDDRIYQPVSYIDNGKAGEVGSPPRSVKRAGSYPAEVHCTEGQV